jgi:hypothetical protein
MCHHLPQASPHQDDLIGTGMCAAGSKVSTAPDSTEAMHPLAFRSKRS